MQLVAVCAVLAAAAVPGGLATLDMFCDCRTRPHGGWKYALHCSTEETEGSVTSCQKDIVPESLRGYRYVSGYALIKLYHLHISWPEAKKLCEDEGAQLAVPPDSHAYDGLKQILLGGNIWHAYIGITDQATEGQYVGVDGRPVSYLPWGTNEPNNKDNEDCVEVTNVGWINDLGCQSSLPFLCERRLSVDIPDTYVWKDDVSRFYKVHTEKLVHPEAAEVCRSENATLAVTDTWSRVEALLTIFPPQMDDYLVGFTDEAVEGDFVTETGRHLRDMEFQFWAPNEPNNNDKDGKAENCLALRKNGNYIDVECNRKLPFICEIVPVQRHSVS